MCWVMPPASPPTTLVCADRVEQRGLAVVDVAHDGHDRRTRLQRRGVVGSVEQAFFDVGLGDAAHRVAEFLGEQLRGVGVDRVGDLRHVTLLHQHLDDVDARAPTCGSRVPGS